MPVSVLHLSLILPAALDGHTADDEHHCWKLREFFKVPKEGVNSEVIPS